ncbi:MAG: hypothetical protein AB7F64_08635 [Gammaproteobacteria bacterium]
MAETSKTREMYTDIASEAQGESSSKHLPDEEVQDSQVLPEQEVDERHTQIFTFIAQAALTPKQEKQKKKLEQTQVAADDDELIKIYNFIAYSEFWGKMIYIHSLENNSENVDTINILKAAMQFLYVDRPGALLELKRYLIQNNPQAKLILGWLLATRANTIDDCVTKEGTRIYIPFKDPCIRDQLIVYTLEGIEHLGLKKARTKAIQRLKNKKLQTIDFKFLDQFSALEDACQNYTRELIGRLKKTFKSRPHEKSKNIAALLNILKSQNLSYSQIVEIFHEIQDESTWRHGANPVAKFFLGKQVTSSWSAAWKEIKELALAKLLETVKKANTVDKKIQLLEEAKEQDIFKLHRNESYFRGFGTTHSVQVIETWLSHIKRMSELDVLNGAVYSSGEYIYTSSSGPDFVMFSI